jgi:hypothetical protein
MMRRILEASVKGGDKAATATDEAADFGDNNSAGSAANSGMNVTPKN